MSDSTSIAVIVLNWNQPAETEACCRSLERQMHRPLHVWVVDNGSTANTADDLRRACPQATVIRLERNLGFAGGNNAALRAVMQQRRPEAIWLLNNDAVVDPDTLPRMLACLKADERIGAVGSVICEAKPPHRLQAWGGGWISPWLGIPWPCSGPQGRMNYLCGASLLLRTAAVEQVGWLDERFFFYFEDADYSFRLRQAGWSLAVAPEARVLHKGGGSIGSQSEQAARLYRSSLIRFLRKHSPVPIFPAVFTTALRLAVAGMKGHGGVVRGTLAGWREGWT